MQLTNVLIMMTLLQQMNKFNWLSYKNGKIQLKFLDLTFVIYKSLELQQSLQNSNMKNFQESNIPLVYEQTFSKETVLQSQLSSKQYTPIILSQSKCVMGNQSFMVCIDQSCNQNTPFICANITSCKCSQIHMNCDQKRLTAIEKIIDEGIKTKRQSIDKIQILFDSIQDKISNFSDHLISKLQSNQSIYYNEQAQYIQMNEAIKNNKISGNVFYKVFNGMKRMKDEKQKVQRMKNLEQKVSSFKQNELKHLFHTIQKLFITKKYTNTIFFHQNNKHKYLQVINETKLKCTKQLGSHVYGIIYPNLQLIMNNPQYHKIKIVINNVIDSIFIGTCNIRQIQLNNFNFYNAISRGHITDIRKFTFEGGRSLQQQGVDVRNDDVILIEYDTISQRLKFTHEKTKAKLSMRLRTKQRTYDDMYITIGLKKLNQQVQIIQYVPQTPQTEQQKKLRQQKQQKLKLQKQQRQKQLQSQLKRVQQLHKTLTVPNIFGPFRKKQSQK